MTLQRKPNAFYDNLLARHRQEKYSDHFNMIRVEELPQQQEKPLVFSRRSYFKVSLVTGHSLVHYADQSLEIAERALVFTNPMIPYSWERIGEIQAGHIAIFDKNFIGDHDKFEDYPVFRSASQAVVNLSLDEFTRFELLFKRMEAEFNGNYKYRFSLLRGLVLQLIHDAQQMLHLTGESVLGSTAYERLTLSFVKLLEESFSVETNYRPPGELTPGFFADRLNIHVNHLNKVLREITGQTTSALIRVRMVQEVKILLRNSDWSVSEIAWALGFNDPNHFSSFVKKNTGLSPTGFRAAKMIE